jgi:C-terminal processing protease CtpA/Prc
MMIVELGCALLLQGSIAHSARTVGVLGYRESLFGHRVVRIHPGSPIEGLLEPGDNVVAVDGNRNNHVTLGQPGSPVTLTVMRGDRIFDVTVKRVAVQDLHSSYLNSYFGVKE